MPERYYLPSTGAAAISPAIDSSWNANTASPSRLKMVTTRISSAMTNVGPISEGAGGQQYNVFFRQYVTDPLPAQTIEGMVQGYIRASESNTSANANGQMVVKAVSGDGTIVRGVLLAANDSTATGNPANEFTTTLSSRLFPGVGGTMTPVTIQAGDRVVVEIGTRNHSTATTNYTTTLNFGDNSATDLTTTAGVTTANNPWIEFSRSLTDPPPPTVTETLTATADTWVESEHIDANAVNANHGTETTLEIDYRDATSNGDRRTYVMFDIPTGGTVLSAVLRLYALNLSGSAMPVRMVPATWTETGLTWANQPTLGTTLATFPIGSLNSYADVIIPVDEFPASGPVAFALTLNNSNGGQWSSREGSFPPQLVLEREDTGTTTVERTVVQVATISIAGVDTFSRTVAQTASIFVDTSVPETITLSADADTELNSDTPTANFGSAASVSVDNASPLAHGMFRFVVPSGGEITEATLRLYATNATTQGPTIHVATDNGWDEATVTWNTAPAYGASIATITSIAINTWMEVDVTASVPTSGPVTFVVVPRNQDGTAFNTKEAASNQPQLVVTRLTGGPTTASRTAVQTAAIKTSPRLLAILTPDPNERRNRVFPIQNVSSANTVIPL